jgi:hypothetical protein
VIVYETLRVRLNAVEVLINGASTTAVSVGSGRVARMVYPAHVVHVLTASPSDVSEERRAIRNGL